MLQRADFTADGHARLVARHGGDGDGDVVFASEAELDTSRLRTLTGLFPGGDLWVFGYGSLIWNPAMVVAETVSARLQGWHRGFCHELRLGRATPDEPGLMLGLLPGGVCDGVAHRIAAPDVASETAILWRREMTWGSYRPRWCRLDLGARSEVGVTFVSNPDARGHLPGLSLPDQARRIARAEGPLGTCREYLFRTRDALVALGLVDDYLDELNRLVERELEPAAARRPS